MNATSQHNPLARDLDDQASDLADRADSAIGRARRTSDGALDTLQARADSLREKAPAVLRRAAGQLEDLKHRSVEAARNAKATVQDQAQRASDRTVGYIRDEPMKSVLIAAAVGAAALALAHMLTRDRGPSRWH